MAERFGGKFSPQTPLQHDPKGTATGRMLQAPPRHRLEGRPFWTVMAAIPFLLGAFGDGPGVLAFSLSAFAAIAAAAWITREGLRAEAAYDARKTARRPALPRKALGAVLFGLGIGLGATNTGLGGALLLGLTALVLHLLAFGLDPIRDKGMEGVDPFQQDRVARVVAEGEKHLAAMKDAILRAGDRRLEARVEMFAATARDLFHAVENDPTDLTAARKYMGVYLMGARDATAKFADLWAATRDPNARTAYEALLTDLETNFTARTASLMSGGREDLDVEIDVLRDRLAREGIVTRESGDVK
ncbi:5-bromo-4-chloroindolyl phosphate hydrolysis family protein [Phaeovulum sp.]|uniref:5-bromo-4-chloroindolyl phosphate hydrolysis family protein n=1 Tax=Phaeovulum sp. TaxID=2934796 RepID=UPI0039E612E5